LDKVHNKEVLKHFIGHRILASSAHHPHFIAGTQRGCWRCWW